MENKDLLPCNSGLDLLQVFHYSCSVTSLECHLKSEIQENWNYNELYTAETTEF